MTSLLTRFVTLASIISQQESSSFSFRGINPSNELIFSTFNNFATCLVLITTENIVFFHGNFEPVLLIRTTIVFFVTHFRTNLE